MIQKAFSEKIHRIFAECDPCNTGSWKLLEGLGFIREACFKKECAIMGKEIYNIINDMAEVLNASQMQKLLYLIVCRQRMWNF